VRHFCLDCADEAAAWPESDDLGGRLRLPTLVGLVGLVLMLVGLLGDFLVSERHAGFGWRQQSGVLLAVVVILMGLLLRVDLLALAGGFLLAASVSADWFGLTSGAGIGWKQQTLIAAGALLLVTAAVTHVARRLSKERRKAALPSEPHTSDCKAAT